MSAPPRPGLLEGPLRFQRHLDRCLATRVGETPWGAVIHRDDLPRVWDLNVVLVERAPPGLYATALMARAERLQAGLPQRAIRVDHEEAAPDLVPHFAAAGWKVQRTVVMVLRRGPTKLIDSSAAAEVGVDQIQSAREAAIGHIYRDHEIAAQLVAAGAIQHPEARVRAFAALVGREVAAYCLLRIGDGGSKLVEVQALPLSQGHSLGRATIWAAVLAARRERAKPIFVECRDEQWEKAVYRRLGFDEVGAVYRFIRPWTELESVPILQY